jgi:hypothetical protein
MSSHHFVKEGQEPALFLLDAIAYDLVTPLLEWAPLVIVHEDVLDQVVLWGIKADVVILTTLSQNTAEEMLAHQLPVKFLQSGENEGFETSLNWLIQSGQRHVNVCALNPDVLLPRARPFYSRIDIALLDNVTRWLCISSKKYSKWLQAGSMLTILVDTDFEVLEGALERSGNDLTVVRDSLIQLVSNEVFWVTEPLY